MTDVIYIKRISREDAKNNPHRLFIYGDNDERRGYGGLAKELRYAKHAVGIRVKKKPTTDENAYYLDEEYEENIRKIKADIEIVKTIMIETPFSYIIFPADGIGTGLAQMRLRCPKTFKFLCNELMDSLDILNGVQE